jgi:DNA-binding transcriptional LysR family regulator
MARLNGDDGKIVEVSPRPRFFADESVVLLRSAIAGLGIACLPESIAAPAVRDGSLTIVLPEWTAGTITTTILTPHRRSQLPSVRAVIDFLATNRTPR